jgi:hypothetical protein
MVDVMTTPTASTPLSGITRPFLGSQAINEGLVNARELRSPLFTRLFHNVYAPAHLTMTHALRCRAAALIAPEAAILTGASAAAVRGHELAAPFDPVEFVVAETDRFAARRGLHVRRSAPRTVEGQRWHGIRIAAPERATLDILRDTQLRRSLPRAVGWLDALLREGFVDATAFAAFLGSRRDHGVVRARRAFELADPRSESIFESEARVWLRLDGLAPHVRIDVLGFRLGLCFPFRRVAVELDEPRQDDLERVRHAAWRRHRLRAVGWEFVIVTPEQLRTDPKSMVEAVRQALGGHTRPLAA